MNLSINYGAAGGVTAESLGIPAPDCGPKAAGVLDANGMWQCVDTESGGGLGSFLAAAAVLAWLWWKFGSSVQRVKAGHVEDLV